MIRNYSKDGLLKMYQEEANHNKDRKLTEKNARILEERSVIDNINRKLDEENKARQNSKLVRINEFMQEYNKMLEKKQNDKENRGNRKFEKNESVGTLKIGGENRSIRKKNYDEISNSLVLNPTKESPVRGRNEVGASINNNKRGSSHGFNIINHSAYDNPEHIIKSNYARVSVLNNENLEKDGARISHLNNNQPQQNNNNTNEINNFSNINNRVYSGISNKYQNQNIDMTNNLEDFHYRDEYSKEQEKKAQQSYPTELDDPEFQKFYEEYLRKKLHDEMNNSKNDYRNQNNGIENESNLKQQNYNRGNGINNNAIENEMSNLNIRSEQENEFLNNKLKNQNGYNHKIMYNNYDKSYQSMNSRQLETNLNVRKLEQQENYRNSLQLQIQEKNNKKNLLTDSPSNSFNHRKRLAKKDVLAPNPYSTKNYEFGSSKLSINPITNPVNSYQFNYNKFDQPTIPNNNIRQVGSGRMREVGNNIMK